MHCWSWSWRRGQRLAANNVGITQRGVITRGYFADIVLFDAATITDHATFETPQAPATGIRTVWVNGAVVFDAAQPTGRYAGRALRRSTAQQRKP